MRHAANVLPVIPNLIVRLQTHPERYSRRFTLLSVILMIMSGVAFVITPRVFAHYVVFPTEALLLALVGGLSLGVAIHFARTAGSLPVLMTPTDQPISSDRVVWLPVVIGGVLLALVTEISVRWLDIPLLRNVDSHLQLALLGIGIALIVWGLSGTPKPRLPGITRAELLIVGGIILAALVIRLWGLDTTVRLLLDEMNFVDGARHAEDTTNLRILVPMSGLSPLYVALLDVTGGHGADFRAQPDRRACCQRSVGRGKRRRVVFSRPNAV